MTPLSPLAAAAKSGDAVTIRRLLAEGAPVEAAPGDRGTPLWHACASDADTAGRLEAADALLQAGAAVTRHDTGETALHAAARHGPLALVERLIRASALEWQHDSHGHTPLHAAQHGHAPDKTAIAELLDRPVIRDPAFRAAVTAIQHGDIARLTALLDAEPRLLRDAIEEPACYREANRFQYFRDPKLFWFIANNPTLIRTMPANIADIAETMIARGVDQTDLDYALELVMTSSLARAQGHQARLIAILLHAGANVTARAIDVTLGHRELPAIKAVLEAGNPLTLPIAAGLGRLAEIHDLLPTASQEDIQTALGMATINGKTEAARLALKAGADPNRPLPIHSHSLPLHQAVIDENLELIDLLLTHGARTDIADTLWHSTPLGWAIFLSKPQAKARLEAWARSAPD